MTVEFLTLADRRLAYQRQVGDPHQPTVVFLSGFASDMQGSKASFLATTCARQNISYLRFDYRGCGASSGMFTDGTVGGWLDDTLAVSDALTTGPLIVIGSSMGGWLALGLAQARAERVKAVIGIAAAPDFTEDLIWKKLTPSQRATLQQTGELYDANAPQDYNFPITLKLIEEARAHLVLRQPLSLSCPLRLLQGMQDREVPWDYALRIASKITHNDVQVTLIKNGDHRLSTPENLALLWQQVAAFFH